MTEWRDPQRMLERAKHGLGPSEADRLRVEAALERRLDALMTDPTGGGGVGGAGGGGSLLPARGGWLPLAGVTAGVVALATAAVLFWPSNATTPTTAPSASEAPTLAATSPSEAPRAATRGRADHALGDGASRGASAERPAVIEEPLPAAGAALAAATEAAQADDDGTHAARPLPASDAAKAPSPAALRTRASGRASGASAAPERRVRNASKASAQAAAASVRDAAEDAPSAATSPAATAPASPQALAEARATATEAPRDHLMAELTLIDSASRALRAARPAAAMDALERHRELYGRGRLGVEREALTALALCDLGKTSAARSRAATFLQRHPSSPLTERVQRAADCGL